MIDEDLIMLYERKDELQEELDFLLINNGNKERIKEITQEIFQLDCEITQLEFELDGEGDILNRRMRIKKLFGSKSPSKRLYFDINVKDMIKITKIEVLRNPSRIARRSVDALDSLND